MPLMEEGQPPAWNTHISVDDAGAIARAVQENGGTMVAEPMEVGDYARLAMFTDPEGAFFGIWEPQVFAGAELVNEKGALGWNELESRDPEGAKRFYGAVFGWEFQDHDIKELGGQVHFGPVDIPAGRFAMVADPWGAGFAVMKPSEQTLVQAREQGLI